MLDATDTSTFQGTHMPTQIPPYDDNPDDQKRHPENDRSPAVDDAPPDERDPMLEQEDYKLPPMESPAPIREPRLPGA